MGYDFYLVLMSMEIVMVVVQLMRAVVLVLKKMNI